MTPEQPEFLPAPRKGEHWRSADGAVCVIVTVWRERKTAGVVVRWPNEAADRRALYEYAEFLQTFSLAPSPTPDLFEGVS